MAAVELCDILSNLKAKPEETKAALDETIRSLINDDNERRVVGILESGLPRLLLGLLRCTDDIDLLCSASQLLSVLTHGSDTVRAELAKLKTVSVLIPLLLPPPQAKSLGSRQSEWAWVPVQEHVLAALRKVTFHCAASQAAFVRMGGVSKLVKLCNYDATDYPPETMERLKELVVNKLLVAAVVPVKREEKKISSSIFPVLSHFKAIDYPLYYADLADEKKAWLTDTLVEEGLGVAASPNRGFLDSENLAWIIARGVCVSGPKSVWLNFSVDKTSEKVKAMYSSLQNLPRPSALKSPPISGPLSPSVYAVWKGEAWYRGWLLGGPSEEKKPRTEHLYTFFCLDYGFETRAPLSHVTHLPDDCHGIAPQAAPCILVGMDPPPRSYTMLRHITAIFGNLAFDNEVYRREIKVVGGVSLLLELLNCPDECVKENALCALLNLTHSKEVCQLIRQLGVIQILTELCILPDCPSQSAILCHGILKNILIRDSEDSLEVFEAYLVYDRLSEWAGKKSEQGTLDNNRTIEEVLYTIRSLRSGEKFLFEHPKPSLTCAPFPKQIDTTPKKQSAGGNTVPASPSSSSSSGSASRNRKSPIYRMLSSEMCKSVSSTPTHSVPLLPLTCESEACLVLDSKILRHHKDHIHFIDISCTKSLLGNNMLLRSLCALANEESGGCVYLGVASNGTVHGISLERNERDIFRRDIDRLVNKSLVPSLDDRYKVIFVPVISRGNEEDYNEGERLVIQISVSPSLTNTLHFVISKNSDTDNGKSETCYVSRDGQCVKLSLLEVQEIVETREVEKYQTK